MLRHFMAARFISLLLIFKLFYSTHMWLPGTCSASRRIAMSRHQRSRRVIATEEQEPLTEHVTVSCNMWNIVQCFVLGGSGLTLRNS